MKIIFISIIISVCCIELSISAPARMPKDILLIPTRFNPLYNNIVPYAQTRGPFDFIGNWIQSSDWFPIEINVPDTFANIGNGVGTFATNVGSGFNNFAQNVGMGFQTFSQNVGNGVQNFAQNLSQRFPVLGVFVRPNSPPRYFVLVPTKNNDMNQISRGNIQENHVPYKQIDSDILDMFP